MTPGYLRQFANTILRCGLSIVGSKAHHQERHYAYTPMSPKKALLLVSLVAPKSFDTALYNTYPTIRVSGHF
jgi:hypothetical protein